MSNRSRLLALASFALLLWPAAPLCAAARPVIWTGMHGPATAGSVREAISGSIGAAAQPANRSWPAMIGENFGSPMFYDLNGDGTMEVITTDRVSTYVFSGTGGLLPGWPRPGGSDNIPAVADIDEDGSPEILVASPGGPGKIWCYNVDGTNQAGFPVMLPYQNWLNVTAPAVADVDGDGHLDVGAQSEPGVAFFDRFGQPLPGWPYLWSTTQNIPWSAPAVADLDDDGSMEVVVGTNILYNCGVHVIRSDGTGMPGWPRPTENIFSSPAVADLDGDGDLEIVIQEGDPTWYGNRMHVWHHDGTYVSGWPREIAAQWESSRSNPAIADVDGDGTLEIVTLTGDGRLHIIRIDGTEFPGYPRLVPGGSISSVQVVDMDGDGLEEFFLCYYAGTSQVVSGWRLDGRTLTGFPKLLFSNSQLDAHSSVHLADLEGDGDLDLCAQGQNFGGGRVWVYQVDGSDYHASVNRTDWPKIRHDVRNTGFYARRDPAGVAGAAAGPRRLTVSPNPVRLTDVLSLRGSGAEGGRVTLFDTVGRRCGGVALTGPAAPALPARSLFGREAAGGVYYLRLETAEGRSAGTTKVVVLDR